MTAPPTSLSTTPPPVATRLLLVRDGRLDAAASRTLGALLATYMPVVVCASDAAAAALAMRSGAPLRIDARLGGDDDVALAAAGQLVASGDASVAIVAAEQVVRALVCFALGVPRTAGQRIHIDAGAVSVVEVGDDGRWVLVRLNERYRPAAG